MKEQTKIEIRAYSIYLLIMSFFLALIFTTIVISQLDFSITFNYFVAGFLILGFCIAGIGIYIILKDLI